jgi:3-methyladenine DNA glycosylase AlkD
MLAEIRRAIRGQADAERAQVSRSFFKTGPGEYGAGDRFLGLTVPEQRAIAKRFTDLADADLRKLLVSPWHEERFVALVILTRRFTRGDAAERQRIVRQYLAAIPKSVNSWDLVDVTAYKILGEYIVRWGGKKGILDRLARSRNLWARRVAMVATLACTARGNFVPTLRIADILLKDPHDLIHKATGWMLREVGKRDRRVLERFLASRHRRMPRTMFRYAIERLPEARRRRYLLGMEQR